MKVPFAIIIILTCLSTSASELADVTFKDYVGSDGAIKLPKNFRDNWRHLGSWVVRDEKAPGYGFHDVYTQPETIDAYHENGKFPDGAILIKEIRNVKQQKMTTGLSQWAGDTSIWFVMVKNSKGRFAGNPNWAEGWGWALFEAKNPETDVSKGFKESCFACHIPAKETDWVYIFGYPTLRSQQSE